MSTSTIQFTNEDFVSLGFNEFLSQWNNIGLEDLAEPEAKMMLNFLNLCNTGDGQELDMDNVLLVKAADGGILKQVYGPGVFRRDDALILKVGGNKFAIEQNKTEMTIGGLVGSLSFESKPVKAKIKDEQGDEQEIEIYPATLDLMPSDGSEQEYRVRCHFDAAVEPMPAAIKSAMRGGKSIAKFFKEPSAGGGNGSTIAMKDLGEGEFAVTEINTVETKDGRTSYTLTLDDDRQVWSRGNVDAQLKSGYQIKEGQPLTLVVANIKVRTDGKTSLDCALRERAPRAAGEKVTPKAKATKPVEKELVAAVAETVPDFDDMPF